MPDPRTPVRVRLKGITALVRRLKQQLSKGTPAATRSAEDTAGRMLSAVETLISSGKVDPVSLTPASRKAYQELQNLSKGKPAKAGIRPRKVRLSGGTILNLQANLSRIQTALAETTAGSPQAEEILADVGGLAGNIHNLCREAGISRIELNPPSAGGLAWLEYLSLRDNLERHQAALKRFDQAVESLATRKTRYFKAAFSSQTATYRFQRSRTLTTVSLNEGFIDAPLEVLRALAAVVSGSRSKAARQLIAAYTISPAYLAVTRELAGEPPVEVQRLEAGRLVEIFDRLNIVYFRGELTRPHLNWSKRSSRRVLGTYAPASDTILISMALQGTDTPAEVLDYVMYHEMLHKLLGTRLAGRSRRVHTAEFRRREAEFAGFERVQAMMKSSALSGWRLV